jgi:soluble P-type ATPase
MAKDLYHTAPSDEMFEEIQTVAIRMLKKHDTSKQIKKIKALKNINHNYMKIIETFDGENQIILLTKIRRGTAQRVMEAIG